jgi:hypothetical protein
VLALAGVLAALALAGCGGGGDSNGQGTITTPEGSYSIETVEVTDRYPAGCSDSCLIGPPGSSSSQQLQAGRQLVIVALEPDFEGTTKIEDRCPGDEISVVADDASKHSCTAVGRSLSGEGTRGTIDLLFGTSAGTTGFTLHVPDNDPIELDAE